MTGSINKVVLLGNLGRDPEIRHSNSGKKIASFSIATSETWKDSSNNRQERTEWHRIVVFNSSIADFVERFVKKGSKVYVEGSLQSRKWTDKDGQERFVTEIVVGQYKGELILLDPRGENGEAAPAASSSGWDSTPDAEPPADAFSDEIPF
ncbi:MAG: single-stranded DNA-binding protein [Alphaproteobacteria bacterium]|nr:single-stranded DNA-binding protein [Alphaproteobacteria bacterium]